MTQKDGACRIYVYRAGLCSPLGASFAECAQSYTAGKRNFRRNPHVAGIDGMPVTLGEVYPYETLRDYPERMLRLSSAALDDLAAGTELPKRTEFHVLLEPWVQQSPIANEIRVSVGLAGRQLCKQGQYVHYGQQAEALNLIGKAATWISEGKTEAIIVGSVASSFEASVLDAMAISGRIKSRLNDYGGFPSEAGAYLLISTSRAFAGKQPIAEILGSFTAREDEHPHAPQTIVGRGLAQALRQATKAAEPNRLMSDATGERWRAEELGFALSAVGPTVSRVADDIEAPCLYLGDCGAALGATLPILALTAPPARKGAAPVSCQGVTLICASSPDGARTVLAMNVFPHEEQTHG